MTAGNLRGSAIVREPDPITSLFGPTDDQGKLRSLLGDLRSVATGAGGSLVAVGLEAGIKAMLGLKGPVSLLRPAPRSASAAGIRPRVILSISG